MELQKAKPENVDGEEILSFVEVIPRYLDDDDSEECETNQGIIGIRDLFRGHVVKVWSGTNFSDRKYHKLNKIAVRSCVKHYYDGWIDRNKACHEETVQMERMMKLWTNA